MTAWVALALVTSLARTGQAPVAGTLLSLFAYAAAMLIVVRPALRALLRRILDRNGALALLLLVALASAAIAEWIGIHALS